MADVLISGARVVTPEAVVETDVLIRRNKIRLVQSDSKESAKSRAAPVERIDGRGCVLLPGFVDIHTHGYDGFDFMLGVYDVKTDSFDPAPGRSLEALGRYVERMPQTGLTTAYLATLASPAETIRQRLGLLKEFLKSYSAGPRAGAGLRLLGAFLEGTFISDKMCGAMNPALVQRPDVKLFDHINESGLVRLALVAPETNEAAALALIRHLSRLGIIVGAGHTQATADQLRAAQQVGLKYMVHFLNGPTGHNFKPFDGGGAVEGALGDERLYCELIADGCHVNPRYVRDLVARKGSDRVIAISDSMFAAGAKGLKSFQMNGVFGHVSPDGKYLSVATNPAALFGSCLDMATAFANLLSWVTSDMPGIWTARHAALALDEALVAVARMTASNACRMVGLDKSLGIGSLVDGGTADLVLGRLSGKAGAWHLAVQRTFVEGREVYRR
jgi:N-acetylglucosamine-6-phosphate deacetylase